MKQTYHLVEQLKHPRYAWPDSLVFLPGLPLPENVSLMDASGRVYAAQNALQAGESCVALVTSLGAGQHKVFEPTTASVPQTLRVHTDEKGFRLETSLFSLFVPAQKDTSVFSLYTPSTGIEAQAYIEGMEILTQEVEVLCQGDVFADVQIHLLLSESCRYQATLRIVEGLDYVTMTETMEGAFVTDTRLRLLWRSFDPMYRLNHYRGQELIDAYLDSEDAIPLRIAPFDSWASWRLDKSAAFIDEERGCSVGLFVRHADLWDDGTYPLWRSNYDFAVCLFYRDRKLSFVYPLRPGVRATGISVFPNEVVTNTHPTGDGLYAHLRNSPADASYIERQWFWQEFLNLQKVQGWTLRWTGEQTAYPRFFPPENISEAGMGVWYLGETHQPFTPEQAEKLVYVLSNSMNQMMRTGAVSNREFADWAIIFDQAIPQMTEEQFADLKAAFAFCAYAFMDENYMPIRYMLAGHPNFLADAHSITALAAALFPEHPDAKRWKNHFELSMARNLKYHVRPDVRAWDCHGGRWTENISCYTFAMLRPMLHGQDLLAEAYGEHVVLYPNLTLLMEYMVGILSAPVKGMRYFPEIGAHSLQRQANMKTLTILAKAMRRYAPLTAEKLWYFGDVYGPSFDGKGARDMYRFFTYNHSGTRPELKSTKYTGYGIVLRSHTYQPDEMNVQLIQIDDGPNYRWGRAGDGNCGTICYYAEGNQYTGQRIEDAGDWNKGVVQSCTNFGVLMNHEYVGIGRNELTEPLYDFGFAQYARVNANEKSRDSYRYRSIIMSENDYITIYDAVRDLVVQGRFSWFNKADRPFPHIIQLKPGVSFTMSDGGLPVDEPNGKTDTLYRGRYYDGLGDFLTLVSHRQFNSDRGTYTTTRPYGVQVDLQGRTDHVFHHAAQIHFHKDDMAFDGKAGILRIYGKNRIEAALFDGTRIAAGGISMGCASDGKVGASFIWRNGKLHGDVQASTPVQILLGVPVQTKDYRLGVNGEAWPTEMEETQLHFTLPAGRYHWEWTDNAFTPTKPTILYTVTEQEGTEVVWTQASGATAYQVQMRVTEDGEWKTVLTTDCTKALICLPDAVEKVHIRVLAQNGDIVGEPCWEYPVYATNEVPESPEGLKVCKDDNAGWHITWGQILGVKAYKLYRRLPGEDGANCIYTGRDRGYLDDISTDAPIAYFVTAVNGYGESEASVSRTTSEDGLEVWDPKPDEKFRRYCSSHEYGYRGFDFEESYQSVIKEAYPD